MNGTKRSPIVVKVLSRADRKWLADGRHHFLNRAAYERASYRLRRHGARPVQLLSVSPFVDLLVALTLLLLPFWGLWSLTKQLCPPASSLWLWFVGCLKNMLRSAVRHIVGVARETLWRQPVRRLGVAVTFWLWLVGLWLFIVVVSVSTGRFGGLVVSLPILLLAFMCWHLLRRWRERVYRPRPLPRRRVRVRHD